MSLMDILASQELNFQTFCHTLLITFFYVSHLFSQFSFSLYVEIFDLGQGLFRVSPLTKVNKKSCCSFMQIYDLQPIFFI